MFKKSSLLVEKLKIKIDSLQADLVTAQAEDKLILRDQLREYKMDLQIMQNKSVDMKEQIRLLEIKLFDALHVNNVLMERLKSQFSDTSLEAFSDTFDYPSTASENNYKISQLEEIRELKRIINKYEIQTQELQSKVVNFYISFIQNIYL